MSIENFVTELSAQHLEEVSGGRPSDVTKTIQTIFNVGAAVAEAGVTFGVGLVSVGGLIRPDPWK
jgi:hypothetical protein